jgi:hypothetical protein
MRFIRLCTEPRAYQFGRGIRGHALRRAPVGALRASRVADARPAHPELPDGCQARRAPVLGGYTCRDGALASPGEPLIELDSPSAL